jgi:hypothetical protein
MGLLDKISRGLLHTSTTAEISLFNERFEFMAKCNGLRGIVRWEHVTEILQHNVTNTNELQTQKWKRQIWNYKIKTFSYVSSSAFMNQSALSR